MGSARAATIRGPTASRGRGALCDLPAPGLGSGARGQGSKSERPEVTGVWTLSCVSGLARTECVLVSRTPKGGQGCTPNPASCPPHPAPRAARGARPHRTLRSARGCHSVGSKPGPALSRDHAGLLAGAPLWTHATFCPTASPLLDTSLGCAFRITSGSPCPTPAPGRGHILTGPSGQVPPVPPRWAHGPSAGGQCDSAAAAVGPAAPGVAGASSSSRSPPSPGGARLPAAALSAQGAERTSPSLSP